MTKPNGVSKARTSGPTPRSVADALRLAESAWPERRTRDEKKNFAEALSRHLSTVIANALRPRFPGISPNSDGKGQERPTRTGKGFKKLDVNYSSVDLGLALGVSVKTINARDRKSGKYAKNFTRVDSELRAEASDYHRRQPYSVLVAIIYLPIDACDDAKADSAKAASSFGHSVRHFRHRVGRVEPKNDVELFERVYVGLYDESGVDRYFDVRNAPPRARRPRDDETMSLEALIADVQIAYDRRNEPRFDWAPD